MQISKLFSSALAVLSDRALVRKEDHKYILQDFTSNSGHTVQANIAIGNPKQDVTVILDTGSWTAFIPGSIKGYNENSYSVYDADTSSTFVPTPWVADFYWHPYNATDFHYFVLDEVSWGQGDTSATFENAFVLLTTFQNPIFGLDVPNANHKPHGSVMLMMQGQGVIDDLVFALGYNESAVTDYIGTFTFGEIDHARYTGDLIEIPINDGRVQVDGYSYYERNPTSQYTSENQLPLESYNDTTTMFDTGGINFLIPVMAFQNIMDLLGQKDGHVDCQKVRDLDPVVVFSIGGYKLNATIPLAERLPSGCKLTDHFEGIGRTDKNYSAQGPGFFRELYTVWDYTNKRMLFGNPVKNPDHRDIRPAPSPVS